jgi:hypothetical protein
MYRSVAFNRIHRDDDDDDGDEDNKHELHRPRNYAGRASSIAHISSYTPSFSLFLLPSAH